MTRFVNGLPLSRIAALAILFALLAVVWMVVIDPLWSAWKDRVDEADRSAELIVRLRHSAAEAPGIREQLAKLSQAQRDRSAVLIAANANLAGAALQAEVKRIAESDGAALRSIQQLPPIQQAALNRIGVRADFQTDTARMADILYDIETHSPVLIVRALSVRAAEQQSSVIGPHPQQLAVQLEVTAFTGAPE